MQREKERKHIFWIWIQFYYMEIKYKIKQTVREMEELEGFKN